MDRTRQRCGSDGTANRTEVSIRVSVDRPRQPTKPTAGIDLEHVRESVRRDRPSGSSAWTQETSGILGLEYSLRLRGRPRAVEPPAGDETTYNCAKRVEI